MFGLKLKVYSLFVQVGLIHDVIAGSNKLCRRYSFNAQSTYVEKFGNPEAAFTRVVTSFSFMLNKTSSLNDAVHSKIKIPE